MSKLKYPKYLAMGDKFGRLTVIGVDGTSMWKENGTIQSPTRWKYICQCNCYEKTITKSRKDGLVGGNIKSCGCRQREKVTQLGLESTKINPIEIEGDITKIFFFNAPGEYTIIDTEDYDKVKDFCWCKSPTPNGNIYAVANAKDKYGKSLIKLHQIICPCTNHLIPDHENNNGLDNRKANLRPLTNSQNQMNKKRRPDNTSGVTGVWWNKLRNKWVGELKLRGTKVSLGYYVNQREAIKARYFGEKIYFRENAMNWKLKYTDNQEILNMIPWLEEEYEKVKDTLVIPEKYKHLLKENQK